MGNTFSTSIIIGAYVITAAAIIVAALIFGAPIMLVLLYASFLSYTIFLIFLVLYDFDFFENTAITIVNGIGLVALLLFSTIFFFDEKNKL